MSTTTPPSSPAVDPDEAPPAPGVDLAAQSETLADSFSELAVAWWRKVRNGESGMLPVILGLVAIVVIFQTQSSKFLTAGNLVNLLEQGSVFILLGMAQVFVLLLGEIDLSAGYVGAVGAAVTVAMISPAHDLPWWVAVVLGLAVAAASGVVMGLLITLLKLPSFVVTLAGLLAFQGVLLWYLNWEGGPSSGGTISIPPDSFLADLVHGTLGVVTGWIVVMAGVALMAVLMVYRDAARRSAGLAVPPFGLVVLRIVGLAGAGVLLVVICNINRGGKFAELKGVPYFVLVVIGVLAVWTFLLDRTRFGRYIYAIGGNAEAARRAGIKVTRIRVIAFGLTSLTAGMAGIIYASRLGSISTNVNGGQLVLYAVAAAVIGGTSLFGGRGKMIHALLGGLVIAAIYNGMGLIHLSDAVQYMVTALVLLAAVTVDAVSRRGRAA
jgi:D-xylose transport system permease protein